MDKLRRRQQVLIGLITRVGGRKNIQKWMDELLTIDSMIESIDTKTAQQTKEEMINYQYQVFFSQSEYLITENELKALAEVWQGEVKGRDIITNIYPEDVCDVASYQLHKAGGWDFIHTKEIAIKNAIASEISSLDDISKFYSYCSVGHFQHGNVNSVIADYTHGLPREYCGKIFVATGKQKECVTYDQFAGDGDNITTFASRYTKREFHLDGKFIWDSSDKETYQIPTESEILEKIYEWIANYCEIHKTNWQGFKALLIEKQALAKANDEKRAAEEAAKALAIPEPEWCRQNIFYSGSNQRFWIGDDGVWSFNWSSSKGGVVGHYDDRIKKVETATYLGSDEATVMAFIAARKEEQSVAFSKLRSEKERKEKIEETYAAYKA
ncbi:MAG: hypothetical protein ACKPFK_00080, partial [Dolichospermum sp.]